MNNIPNSSACVAEPTLARLRITRQLVRQAAALGALCAVVGCVSALLTVCTLAGCPPSPPSPPPPTPCNCGDCVADPALTCSYTGEDVSVEDAYIANAYKGDLILSPGGASGPIGGLLHQLNPPQHYSHMGIMVSDYNLIRHSCGIPDRLTAKEYYTGSVFGIQAPLNGINPDHVEWAWPGTVTQSVYQASYADQYGDGLTPPGMSGPYHGADLVDTESPSQKAYLINALSFDKVSDDGVTWYPALVVKPCPLLETPDIRAALERVADEALQLYTYYSFYAYSNGSVGESPGIVGPAFKLPDAQPAWDSTTLRWQDWTTQPAETHTPLLPAVCSSFVWQAVQNVNKAGSPKIHLDWATTQAEALGEDAGQCIRAVAPDWTADQTDASTRDGLYVYDEASRARAAQWLNDHLSQQVYDSLKQALRDEGGVQKAIAAVLDDVGRGSFVVAATVGSDAVISLLNPLLGTALTAAEANDLIELFYDMPNDIANQVCNAFAFGCYRGFPGDTSCVDAQANPIADVDSTNWSDAPGVGRAVSPDNIHMFWDAPGSANVDQVSGLYGYNEPVQKVVGVVRRPKCAQVPSTGTATIAGFVSYKGQIVQGAYVKAGCQHTVTPGTNADGQPIEYQLDVHAGGQYKVVARYTDPVSGKVLYGERATGTSNDPPIAPGSTVPCNILLIEPPECMRNVAITGWIRVDDVYVSGADHADNYFSKTLYVQYGVASFDENTGSWVVDPNDGQARQTDSAVANASTGDSNGVLAMSVKVNSDLSVDVTLTGTLNPGDDNLSTSATIHVPKDATVPVSEANLDTGGLFNDRAYFRNVTISNQAAQAI